MVSLRTENGQHVSVDIFQLYGRTLQITPPFQIEAAFRTAWPEKPVIEIPVAANDVARSIRLSDRHLAIHETVSLFADPILRKLREEEIAVDLWFVVIPDDVYLYGRPLSKVPRSEQVAIKQSINQRFAKRLQTSPSLFEEDMRLAEKYLYGVDFHNQLKARLLLGKVTTQVVRESSLLQLVEPNATSRPRRLQDPATVAWNLCTAAFYKANGRPWRLKRIREKVCYIGLVFKKYDEHSESANACCGAQMFLELARVKYFAVLWGHGIRVLPRNFISREVLHGPLSRRRWKRIEINMAVLRMNCSCMARLTSMKKSGKDSRMRFQQIRT